MHLLPALTIAQGRHETRDDDEADEDDAGEQAPESAPWRDNLLLKRRSKIAKRRSCAEAPQMPHCVTKTRLKWAHLRTNDSRRFPAKHENRVQALLQEQSARAKIIRGSCAHDRPASAVAKPCQAEAS